MLPEEKSGEVMKTHGQQSIQHSLKWVSVWIKVVDQPTDQRRPLRAHVAKNSKQHICR